jgi:hypothetical protein
MILRRVEGEAATAARLRDAAPRPPPQVSNPLRGWWWFT